MPFHSPDKILIVDDDPQISEVLKLYLETEGYAISWTDCGKTAMEMLSRGNNFSLVLLDISMPDIDGITVLKIFREADFDTAVIMMTGQGSEQLAVECMRNGAEDYIAKPFAMKDLLQRIKRALNHRLAIIEKRQLDYEKENFYLMLSHDLKNPMTAAIGSIDIIREGRLGPVNEEQIDYLQSAIDSCNEVVTMIDNLLDIRRFEAGKMPLTIRPYSPEIAIRKIAEQFRRTARNDGIILTLQLDRLIPDIAVDSRTFVRILGNLLANALKFTPEGGEVVLSCECVENEDILWATIPLYASVPQSFANISSFARISVRDTGSGIPPHELGRIFDRYAQSINGSGKERGGAGLGLTFCKWAVESFDGVIWAASEAVQGSEIVILLPYLPRENGCGSEHKP